VGEEINDQIAFFCFVNCIEDGDAELSRAAASAAVWYTRAIIQRVGAGEAYIRRARELQAASDEAGGDLTGRFLEQEDAESTRAQLLLGRLMEGESVPDDEVFEILSEQQQLIVGDQQTCLEKMRRYEEIGIDRLMCFHQVGQIRHAEVMRSIRLIGELIPEFHRNS
jgi:alkanesulfonate monooxygenase SsuD/methylene tetrahydromethanopterin reductase-like flavin-dependent oxidoreductase (luciferase family)